MKRLAWIVLLGAVITVGFLVSRREQARGKPEAKVVPKAAEQALARQVVEGKPMPEPREITNAVAGFREWSQTYFVASVSEREAMVQEGVALAKARRPVMKDLIRRDPRRALEAAVPMVVRQDLPAAVADLLEERVNGPAFLRVYQGVGPDNHSPVPTFRIAEFASQKTYQAYVYGRRAESVQWLSGASLNGIAVDQQLAVHEDPLRVLELGERPDPAKPAVAICPVSGQSSVADEDRGQPITEDTPAIEAFGEIVYLCNGSHAIVYRELLIQAEGGTGAPMQFTGILPAAPTPSIGNIKVLVIPFTFADQNDTPSSESVLYQMMRDVGDHYAKASYGKLTLLSTVTPPVKSPHNEAWYIQKDNSNGGPLDGLGLEHSHARAEARKLGFDEAEFDCVVVRLRGGARPAGGYGGGSSVWIYGDGPDLTAHEVGHAFGLAHANFWNTSGASAIGAGANEEYGGYWDVMGGIGLPYGHYNVAAKNQIKWLPDPFVTEINSSGVYRLYAQDQAILDPFKRYAIKIRKDASRMYWGELRGLYTGHPTRTWADYGFILGWRYPGGGGSNIQLIDTTPGSAFNKDDSPVSLGRTFSDTEAGIHFTTLAINPATTDEPKSVDVLVNLGDFSGNRPPSLSLTASGTVVPLNVPVTFTATASDPDGDVLAYSWQNFGDSNYRTISPNAATMTRTFTSAGNYLVSCTVSDMKGGSALRNLLVTVGNGGGRFTISGRVTIGAQGLAGVIVNANSANGVVTDSDGYYTIPNLTAGTYQMTPLLYGYTFTDLFNNSVTVGPNFSAADFDASPTATVSIQAAVPSCNEANVSTPARFDLVRTGDAAQALVVNVLGPQGTATVTTDYTISPTPAAGSQGFSTLTIPAGAASLSVTVTPVNDTAAEGPETVVLELGPGIGYLIGGLAKATIVIDDDDTTLPKVSLAVGEAKTIEGSSTAATVVFSRTGSAAGALPVPYSIGGTATSGSDFVPLNGILLIPAGQAAASLSITSVNDSVSEPLETVTVAIATTGGLIADPVANRATVSIVDDDVQVVTVTATDAVATERDLSLPDAVADTATFLITRSGDTSEPLTVYYALSGINTGTTATALHGVDYEALPGVLTIPAGQTSGSVTIIPRWDGLGEGPESVTLQLGAGPTNYRLGVANVASITINDAGDPPYVEVLGIDNAAEPGTVGHFRFSLKGSVAGTIAVNYTVSGTAIGGTDYSALSGTVNIGGNGVNTVDVNVTPINDALAEELETVTVTITPGAAYGIFPATSSATIWLRDDERPTLFVDAHSSSTYPPAFAENSTGSSFYISRVGSTNAALTVNYTMSGTAANGADYQTLSGVATIPAGRLGVDVSVVPINDGVAEGTETITLTLAPGSYSAGPPATFYLTDDDIAAITVGFPSTSATGLESAGTVNIPVALSSSSVSPITVEYLVDAGTRASTAVNGNAVSPLPYWVRCQRVGSTFVGSISPDGVNWTGVNTQTLAFAAGSYLAGLYVCSFNVSALCTSVLDNVTITDLEPGGTQGARTGGNIGTTALGGSSSQFGSTYTVAGAGDNVEGTTDQGYFTWWPINNSTNCTITARVVSQQNTFSGATAGVMIRESTVNNVRRGYMAATPGAGFEFHYRNAPVAQEAKVTRIASKPIWVRLERAGNLIRSFQSNNGASWTQIGSSLDMAFGPELLVGLTVSAQAEGSLATATINNVTLTPGPLPLLQGRTVGFTAIQGSDTLIGGEYTLTGSGDGINGTHDDCHFVAAPVTGDFVLSAQITSLDSTSGSPQAGLMLRENTLRAARMVYVGGIPQPQMVSRNSTLTTAHGAGIDYTLAPGLLTFPPGTTTQNIPLSINNDSIPEPDETIMVLLRNPSNARLGANSQFTYVIVDDDSPPAQPFVQFAAASSSGSEAAGTVQIPVTLSTPPGAMATVDYAITAGTATASDDFTPATGTLTFAPGDTVGMISLDITNDAITESSETVLLSLSNPVGLRLSTVTNHTFTIIDDDTPTISISSTDTNASETGDVAVMTVARTGSTNSALTINFTRGGTATAGTDYTGVNTTAFLAAGETNLTLTLVPVQDATPEGTETAIINVTGGVGYVIGRPSSVTNFIADDDRNSVFIVADNPVAFEGGQPGTLTLSREGSTATSLVVNLTISGTATGGTDYTANPSPITPITFGIGEASKTITILPVDDTITEGDEMALIQIAAGSYDIGGIGYASVAIRDNDIPPTVFISSPGAQGVVIAPGNGVEFVAEGDDNGFPQPLTYLWSLVAGPGTVAFGSPTAPRTPAIFSAAGTYLVRITVNDGQFTASDQIAVNIGPTNNLIPNDWMSADIGPPTVRGFSGLSGGSNWVLSAAGIGFTSDSDRAHAVSRQVTGDVTLIARLNSVTGPANAEAGISVRDSMHRYSRRAALVYQASSHALRFRPRGTNHMVDFSVAVGGLNLPLWLKLERTAANNVVAAYYAADVSGAPGSWTQISTNIPITMDATADYSLVADSGSDTTAATATFGQINLTPAQSGPAMLAEDFGDAVQAGTYSYTAGTDTHTLNGKGSLDGSGMFWGEQFTGDFILTALQLDATSNANDSRSGIMIRDSMDDGPMVFLGRNPQGAFSCFVWRTNPKGGTAGLNGITAKQRWFRLIRRGNQVTAMHAPNNSGVPGTWVQLGLPQTVFLQPTIIAGLYCDNAGGIGFNTATFTQFSIVPLHKAPIVDAGTVPASPASPLAISGTVRDDGLPDPFTAFWSVASAPGPVTFANSNALSTSVTFSDRGNYVLRLWADDGIARAFDDLAFSLNTPFQAWQAAHFVGGSSNPNAAADADPDGDGMNNIGEYASGTDPNAAGPHAIVASIVTIGPDQFLRVTVPKNTEATDVVISVETSPELSSPAWTTTGLITEQNTPTLLQVRHNTPVSSANERFMRVRVNLQSP